MIEYKSGDISGFNMLFIGGFITNGNLTGNHYSLRGVETVDTVCREPPTPIVLTGECGENKDVNYQFANGEKTGSTVPPDGSKVYYLFGTVVHCTVNNINQ
jgi:hypothetical protein